MRSMEDIGTDFAGVKRGRGLGRSVILRSPRGKEEEEMCQLDLLL